MTVIGNEAIEKVILCYSSGKINIFLLHLGKNLVDKVKEKKVFLLIFNFLYPPKIF